MYSAMYFDYTCKRVVLYLVAEGSSLQRAEKRVNEGTTNRHIDINKNKSVCLSQYQHELYAQQSVRCV